MVASAFYSRGISSIGGADSPVIPAASEVSLNQNFDFVCGHFFCVISDIEKF